MREKLALQAAEAVSKVFTPLDTITPDDIPETVKNMWPGFATTLDRLNRSEERLPLDAANLLISGLYGTEQPTFRAYTDSQKLDEEGPHITLDNERVSFEGIMTAQLDLERMWNQVAPVDSHKLHTVDAIDPAIRQTWRAMRFDNEYSEATGFETKNPRAKTYRLFNHLYDGDYPKDYYNFAALTLAGKAVSHFQSWPKEAGNPASAPVLVDMINKIAREGGLDLFKIGVINRYEGIPVLVEPETHLLWSVMYGLSGIPSATYLADRDQNSLIMLAAYIRNIKPTNKVDKKLEAVATMHLIMNGVMPDDPMAGRYLNILLGTHKKHLERKLSPGLVAVRKIVKLLKTSGFQSWEHAALNFYASNNAPLTSAPLLYNIKTIPALNPELYMSFLDQMAGDKYNLSNTVKSALGDDKARVKFRMFARPASMFDKIAEVAKLDEPVDELPDMPNAACVISVGDGHQLVFDDVSKRENPTAEDIGIVRRVDAIYVASAWMSANYLLALKLRQLAVGVGAKSIKVGDLDQFHMEIKSTHQLEMAELGNLMGTLLSPDRRREQGAEPITLDKFRYPTFERDLASTSSYANLARLKTGNYHIGSDEDKIYLSNAAETEYNESLSIARAPIALRFIDGIGYNGMGLPVFTKPISMRDAAALVARAFGDKMVGERWEFAGSRFETPVRYKNMAFDITGSVLNLNDGLALLISLRNSKISESMTLAMTEDMRWAVKEALATIAQSAMYGKHNELTWNTARAKMTGEVKEFFDEVEIE